MPRSHRVFAALSLGFALATRTLGGEPPTEPLYNAPTPVPSAPQATPEPCAPCGQPVQPRCAPAQKVIVEVAPPEVIFQAAPTVQRCHHLCHQKAPVIYAAPQAAYAAPSYSYAAPSYSYAAPAMSYAAPAASYAVAPAMSYSLAPMAASSFSFAAPAASFAMPQAAPFAVAQAAPFAMAQAAPFSFGAGLPYSLNTGFAPFAANGFGSPIVIQAAPPAKDAKPADAQAQADATKGDALTVNDSLKLVKETLNKLDQITAKTTTVLIDHEKRLQALEKVLNPNPAATTDPQKKLQELYLQAIADVKAGK